jgi:hypothetical protein
MGSNTDQSACLIRLRSLVTYSCRSGRRPRRRGRRGLPGITTRWTAARRSGAGRKKGSPNKLTAYVKAAIMAASDQVGGVEYLKNVAQTDPRTFCTRSARSCRRRSPKMSRLDPSASNSHGCPDPQLVAATAVLGEHSERVRDPSLLVFARNSLYANDVLRVHVHRNGRWRVPPNLVCQLDEINASCACSRTRCPFGNARAKASSRWKQTASTRPRN